MKLSPFTFICSGLIAVSLTLFPLRAGAASIPKHEDWQIAGPFGGTATALAVDPKNSNILLAGGMQSLLYQSNDAGNSWSPLPLPKRTFGEVNAVLVDPRNPQHYLVGMGGSARAGLFDSADGGMTWTVVPSLAGRSVSALAVSASDPSTMVAGTRGGVFLSHDSGKTWVRISDENDAELNGIDSVAIDPKNPQIIYVGTTHLPWKTVDGGKNWESIHNGMIDDSDVFSIFIDQRAPERLYASACSGIYASANRGGLWRKLMGIPNTHRRTHVIQEDPVSPGTIYAGTTLGLFRSENRGGDWRQLNEHQVNAIAFSSSPDGLFAALSGEGIVQSSDKGTTLKPKNTGFVARRLGAYAVSGHRLVALEPQSGSTTSIFISEDKGETWQALHDVTGLEGIHLKSLIGFSDNEKLLFAANARQLFKSTDGGFSWKPDDLVATYWHKGTVRVRAANGKYVTKAQNTEHKFRPYEINDLLTEGTGRTTYIFAATDRGLLRSKDSGIHWALVDTGSVSGVLNIYASAKDDGRIVVENGYRLFLTENFGETWKPLSWPREGILLNDLAVPPVGSGSPFLAATSQGLYSSVDGGKDWAVVNNGLPYSTVDSVIYSANQGFTAYAVTFGQLYQSKDAGSSWTAVPSSYSSLRIRRLWQPARLPDRLFAVTNDIGILFRNQAIIR